MRCKHASSGLLALEQCNHAHVCFSTSALGAQLTQRKLLWSLCNMCSILQANCLGDVAFRRQSMPHGPRSPTQTSHTHLLRPRGMPSQRTQRRPQHSGSGTLPRRQAPIHQADQNHDTFKQPPPGLDNSGGRLRNMQDSMFKHASHATPTKGWPGTYTRSSGGPHTTHLSNTCPRAARRSSLVRAPACAQFSMPQSMPRYTGFVASPWRKRLKHQCVPHRLGNLHGLCKTRAA